jgi:hypothetical protein
MQIQLGPLLRYNQLFRACLVPLRGCHEAILHSPAKMNCRPKELPELEKPAPPALLSV